MLYRKVGMDVSDEGMFLLYNWHFAFYQLLQHPPIWIQSPWRWRQYIPV